MTITISAAREADLPAILALLERSGLPPDGLAAHVGSALAARSGDQLVGSAALELYDSAALLRSVAVDAPLRGRGLGQQFTRTALNLARQRGIARVYLLTDTAGGFFARLGFRATTRAEVDPAVQQSVEFTSACPASAQVFVADLS